MTSFPSASRFFFFRSLLLDFLARVTILWDCAQSTIAVTFSEGPTNYFRRLQLYLTVTMTTSATDITCTVLSGLLQVDLSPFHHLNFLEYS